VRRFHGYFEVQITCKGDIIVPCCEGNVPWFEFFIQRAAWLQTRSSLFLSLLDGLKNVFDAVPNQNTGINKDLSVYLLPVY
jgi:hypothetical protein